MVASAAMLLSSVLAADAFAQKSSGGRPAVTV
jgi:hypothetical protein